MKQTITINLNGIVYHIDDDAYSVLRGYLDAVAQRLGTSPETAEILQDVEARIGELFTQALSHDRIEVVGLTLVQQVIDQLGQPEDFAQANTDNAPTAKPKKTAHRRFYRDVENQYFAGVCAGLAAYLGWDPFWVRFLFVLCTCLWGVTIPIYLIVWAIAPAATTVAQRLEMRGEEPSVENIKKEYAQEAPKNRPSGASRFFEIMGKIILGGLVLFIAFVFFVLVMGLLFGLGGAALGMLENLFFDPEIVAFNLISEHTGLFVGFVVCCVLLVGLPLVAIVYWLILYGKKRQHPRAAFWWVTIVLWVLSLLSLGGLSLYALHHWDETTFLSAPSANGIPLVSNRTVAPFDAIVADGPFEITLQQAPDYQVQVLSAGPDSILTEVQNGVLTLRYAPSRGQKQKRQIVITAPHWKAYDGRVASELTVAQFQTPDLRLTLSGAAEADLKGLQVERLQAELSGAAELDLHGQAQKLALTLTGASDLDADEMLADTVQIVCSGASEADIFGTQALYLTATGASKIEYAGSASVLQKEVSGGSSISHK